MSEAEQYDQKKCDRAKSDDDKELMAIAMAEKAAKRQEHERCMLEEMQQAIEQDYERI